MRASSSSAMLEQSRGPNATPARSERVAQQGGPLGARGTALSITMWREEGRSCAPVVLALAGVLNEDTSQVLTASVVEAMARRPELLLLDLNRVTQVDPVCLPRMLATAHSVALCDALLRTVARPGRKAHRAIRAAGLGERLDLHPSVDSALTAGSHWLG